MSASPRPAGVKPGDDTTRKVSPADAKLPGRPEAARHPVAPAGQSLRRFSHSLISAYLDCPRKAYYQYIDRVPSPKPAALVRGTACDTAWNVDLEQKITTGADIKLDDLLQITAEAFDDDVDEQGGTSSIDWGNGSRDRSRESALLLSRTWHQLLAPDIYPRAVQVRYIRTLPSGRQFIGFVDAEAVIDGEIVTLDNKTAGRRMSASEANNALQPYAYAWLKDEPISFVFARAIDTGKSQTAEFVATQRLEADIDAYGEIVNDVERAWEAGNFPPNPSSHYCTTCPFAQICPVGRARASR